MMDGYSINTKFIPYELFLDFKEIYNISDFINNRISFHIDTEYKSITDASMLQDIADNYIKKMPALMGKWTLKTIHYSTYSRLELMFEQSTDYGVFLSTVLLLDKLSKE